MCIFSVCVCVCVCVYVCVCVCVCKYAHVRLGAWYNRPSAQSSAKISIFVTPVHLLSLLRANTGVITEVHPGQHERRTHCDPGQVLCLVLQQCFCKLRGQSPPPHETFSPAMLHHRSKTSRVRSALYLLQLTCAMPDPMSPPPITVTCFMALEIEELVENLRQNTCDMCAIVARSGCPPSSSRSSLA